MITLSPSDSDTQSESDILSCPTCGQAHRLGELVCPHCGTLLGKKGGTTVHLSIDDKLPTRGSGIRGDAFTNTPAPLVIEIDGQRLTLPMAEELTIGRFNLNSSQQQQPDIDLSQFAAEERGVSRCHVRISSRDILTYVTDLNSSNGTWLNGRRLAAQDERVLRSGDELRLGNLKIKISF